MAIYCIDFNGLWISEHVGKSQIVLTANDENVHLLTLFRIPECIYQSAFGRACRSFYLKRFTGKPFAKTQTFVHLFYPHSIDKLPSSCRSLILYLNISVIFLFIYFVSKLENDMKLSKLQKCFKLCGK